MRETPDNSTSLLAVFLCGSRFASPRTSSRSFFGYLFHSCLTQGLAALRNANLHEIEQYYTPFFQLSIGLERLMKVIVIIDHAARNALSLPTTAILLIAAVNTINGPRPAHPLAFLTPAIIEW